MPLSWFKSFDPRRSLEALQKSASFYFHILARLDMSKMWAPSQPIYIVSVNNTPEVARHLVAILVEVLYIASLHDIFVLTQTGLEISVQSGVFSQHRQ